MIELATKLSQIFCARKKNELIQRRNRIFLTQIFAAELFEIIFTITQAHI